ncbi:chromosome segregation protein SMC [Hyphococcus sp.]|uniref:chromosome segregation protein SMC n=1 Tax=Hyphococcus sp. TaxID=2038636 RepID=UPI003CCC4620
MKFTNVRLVGFKSFVEPTDFEIRDGLTGIVGPNGCGKSNLLEALRWVMGATSAKALRGDGMDAVIFSGTSMRPARNWAEVILTLDNSDRSAPAEYNEHNTLEISRRIIRKEEGTQSIYRINAKEVRAKDVQLLFADASTGANSPALVRQGQVAELISAKPQNRRRLLEEAAGVTGLHSRRHEAELRLRAAETNLERLDDVMGELETQKTALARQARQATRYRNVSGDIRRTEAMLSYLRWSEAVDAQEKASSGLSDIATLIEEATRVAAAASTAQAQAHEALDPLRLKEAEEAAALHRLTVARENLDEEAQRAEAELARLSAEIDRFKTDIAREKELLTDAENALGALAREDEDLNAREASEGARLDEAQDAVAQAAAALEKAEAAFDEKSKEAADVEARRKTVDGNIAAAERRLEKITEQLRSYKDERDLIAPTEEQARALEDAKTRYDAADNAANTAETAFHRAEEERQEAERAETSLRGPLRNAEQSLTELDAEREALRRVLAANDAQDFPPLIELIDVEPGYENALAAALGDDLGAAVDEAAPAHWSHLGQAPVDAERGSPLPEGAAPLGRFVRAPAALTRRLSAIGVVDASDGARLRDQLKPGQRLVSRDGDLWRWDGFTTLADAKTAAAIRLEQRNRLAVLDGNYETAQAAAETARRDHDGASETLKRKQQNEREARGLFIDARRALDSVRTRLNELERESERAGARIASIDENLARLAEEETETARARAALDEERSALPDADRIANELADLRGAVGAARIDASEARASHADIAREAKARADRLAEVARERASWSTRGETAKSRLEDIERRLEETVAAHEIAQNAPGAIEEKRKALLDQIAVAEKRRNDAADALAEGQRIAVEADKSAKAADAEASDAREARARLQAQAEAAAERVEEATHLARETCEAAPEDLLAIAEHKDGADLPLREDVERKLERYKRERENLGGVNLRADEEMKEVGERLEELAVEREDCDNAIRKLRNAIGNLNREARQRLLDAFETVNNNFGDLFKRLFNGGQAELRLIDSDDPLEAGLEIMASPPGKKLASMSLMSGGEQALTATALIFAVFMANPAPVCVLDEVDAPLDDANVERFCRLLHEMAAETETRFIIITHHALTMSRMSRLFGVTMIERGVSQLVSVDLSKAEQLAAAE